MLRDSKSLFRSRNSRDCIELGLRNNPGRKSIRSPCQFRLPSHICCVVGDPSISGMHELVSLQRVFFARLYLFQDQETRIGLSIGVSKTLKPNIKRSKPGKLFIGDSTDNTGRALPRVDLPKRVITTQETCAQQTTSPLLICRIPWYHSGIRANHLEQGINPTNKSILPRTG